MSALRAGTYGLTRLAVRKHPASRGPTLHAPARSQNGAAPANPPDTRPQTPGRLNCAQSPPRLTHAQSPHRLTPLAQSAAGSRLSSPTAPAPKVSCSRRRNCSLLRIAPPVGIPATLLGGPCGKHLRGWASALSLWRNLPRLPITALVAENAAPAPRWMATPISKYLAAGGRGMKDRQTLRCSAQPFWPVRRAPGRLPCSL